MNKNIKNRHTIGCGVLSLGTKTQWGTIGAIRFADGERFYMIVNKAGDVSLIDAYTVEISKKTLD